MMPKGTGALGRLDRDGSTPLYRQLKRLLLLSIAEGRYKPGDRLPSESEFSRTYGVSRHSIRQALASLVVEGRIVSRQGDGYYVNARRIRRELPVLTGYTAVMRDAGLDSQIAVLRQELTLEPAEIAATLNGIPGLQVAEVERLAYLAGEPVALLADYFHPRLADAVMNRELANQPLYEFVEKQTGVGAVRAPTVLSVDFADQRTSALLRVSEGTPLIRLDIWTYGENDFLFSASCARYRSDRFEFTLEKEAR